MILYQLHGFIIPVLYLDLHKLKPALAAWKWSNMFTHSCPDPTPCGLGMRPHRFMTSSSLLYRVSCLSHFIVHWISAPRTTAPTHASKVYNRAQSSRCWGAKEEEASTPKLKDHLKRIQFLAWFCFTDCIRINFRGPTYNPTFFLRDLPLDNASFIQLPPKLKIIELWCTPDRSHFLPKQSWLLIDHLGEIIEDKLGVYSNCTETCKAKVIYCIF